MKENDEASYTDEYDSEVYRNIHQYLGRFQILDTEQSEVECEKASKESSLSASITVFRKKSLDELYVDPKDRDSRMLLSPQNIYEHNLEVPELDAVDSSKSKNSCSRCRKLKRRCSRELPECLGCLSSEKLCVYIPRRGSKNHSTVSSPAAAAAAATSKRDSVCSASSTGSTFSAKRRRTSSIFEGRSRQNSSEVNSLPDLFARKNSLQQLYLYQSLSSPVTVGSTPPSNQNTYTPTVRLPPIEFILNGLARRDDSAQPLSIKQEKQ